MNVNQQIVEGYDTFSKQQQKVADFILNNIDDVIYYPIAKLVETIGVSKATIVRFAQHLGYEGFNDFRDALFSYYREFLSPESRMRHSIESINNEGVTFESIAKKETEYLQSAIGSINETEFSKSVEKISQASPLYIFGAGANEHLASYFHFRMRRLRIDCKLVTASGREICEHFLLVKPGDVAVVYSFSRPSADFLRTMNLLKDHQVDTVLITDMRSPSMTRLATHVLNAERGPRGTFPSPVVPMAISFALLVGVEEKLKERAIAALKTLGDLRNSYYYTDRFRMDKK